MSGVNPTWLVGKTVAQVGLESVPTDPEHGRAPCQDLGWIRFTDGSSVVLGVVELEGEYAIDPTYYPRRIRKGGS